MGNHKLRSQLSKILKEKGFGRMYGNKAKRYKNKVRAGYLRSMIQYYSTYNVGDIVFDYGGNRKIEKIAPPEYWSNPRNSAAVAFKFDQTQYDAGYLSCGCGSIGCEGRPKASVKEIQDYWSNDETEEFAKEWWRDLKDKMNRIKAARLGIQVCDDNGFLLSDKEIAKKLEDQNAV